MLALANSAGGVVNTYSYDPYGRTVASTGTTANPFGFDGQYRDAATGFYKMGQRYYDPAVGRWTQQDPLAGRLQDPQSLDRYAFVEGNPVNFVDPSGFFGLSDIGKFFWCRSCRVSNRGIPLPNVSDRC